MNDLFRANDLPMFRFTNHDGVKIGRLWQDIVKLQFDGNATIDRKTIAQR